jgi:hypothetical protein
MAHELVEAARELFAEREERFADTIALKKPDRVPIFPLSRSFPTHYARITFRQEFTEPRKHVDANFKAVVDFETDVVATTPMTGWSLAPLTSSSTTRLTSSSRK